MKLVLDTNIYSDYAEGLPAVVDFLAIHGDEIYLPSIVLGELSYGFMKGSRQRFNERKLREFIRKLQIEIIDVNYNVARKYGIIYLSLVKKGTKIPINDVWIAACCMEAGGTLVTRDRHFRQVDQVETMVVTT
ncbi:MAG: type II toxin-antitoxin system VapC family toxin [Deltaproteobacteria bacterium]|jgi:predicted nucleic acid-binding protein|nr:type II toxin-antitoxin system VapC family toxin [Deltaproteobacteria bacterium]MBW2478431.1 type II toxin-antitoxin system VapC family toxin [Deltaproteobacteria bacterium]